jgi:hypothetical protein
VKGYLFSPAGARHPMWTHPALGQTTTTTTTTVEARDPASVTPVNPPGKTDLLTLLAVGGAVLLVTEATGLTHVRKWFTKTLGLSR